MTRRVVLIGAVHESLAAFDTLRSHHYADLVGVVTLTEEVGARTSGFTGVGRRARAAGVPVLEVADVNHPDAVERVGAWAPDLIAVVGWTRLIHEPLLQLPPRGVIGFHASLLPRHRGRAPVNWSIILGETETGNTMMMLNAGVDTGGIVDQRRTPIYVDDTCATVYDRVGRLGGLMLEENLEPLLKGSVSPTPQDSDSDVLPKRVPDMGVTDWRRSPVEVHNWIRAQTHPYPGAYTSLRGERVYLWSSTPPTVTDLTGEPGEVLEFEENGVRVAAGPGSLLITKMSGRTEAPTDAAHWCRVNGVEPGSTFESPDPDTARWALGLGPRPEVPS